MPELSQQEVFHDHLGHPVQHICSTTEKGDCIVNVRGARSSCFWKLHFPPITFIQERGNSISPPKVRRIQAPNSWIFSKNLDGTIRSWSRIMGEHFRLKIIAIFVLSLCGTRRTKETSSRGHFASAKFTVVIRLGCKGRHRLKERAVHPFLFTVGVAVRSTTASLTLTRRGSQTTSSGFYFRRENWRKTRGARKEHPRVFLEKKPEEL